MDINKIEMLLRAIELGSLSKASQEFLYTPSAFTHILNGLEKELNTTLIKRSHTGITPLEDKREIISLMGEMVDLYKRILHLSMDNSLTHSINICTYASISKALLPALSKSLKSGYPDLKIDIIVSDNLKKASEKADVIIGEKVMLENYEWEELIVDPYVAVVPVGNEFYNEGFSFEKRYEDTIILTIDGIIRRTVKKENFANVITVKSDDDGSVLEMVKAGMGIAILPRLSVGAEDEKLKLIPIEPKLVRRLGILYENKYKNNPVIRHIASEIKNYNANNSAENGGWS